MIKGRIDEALNGQSKFCYPGTDILINNFDIRDQEQLEIAERRITILKLAEIQLNGIPNYRFDLSVDSLLKIHEFIFKDIYSFAGKIRSENIIKGKTPFCRPEFIYNYLNMLFDEMKQKIRKLKSRDDIVNFLAYYYSELNIVHPFREGNGRTLREFFRQMIVYINELYKTNFELDYSNIEIEDKANLINGSILSAMTGNLELLSLFFNRVLKEKEKTKGHQK